MRFFIVDDDQGVRSMIADIIEEEGLGKVVGETDDGSNINGDLLELKKVDILLIDMLMPVRDGIQTVRALGSRFQGKIIMISQIESKNMIGEAYSLGIEYYITKPVNRLEILAVIRKVEERLRLQKSISIIQQTLQGIQIEKPQESQEPPVTENKIVTSGHFLLSELGMIGEAGSNDFLDMLAYLHQKESESVEFPAAFPSLKEIFINIAAKKLGSSAAAAELNKEIKASEQRVRRAIFQTITHVASLGLTDYSHPKFENYASKFFDFTEIRKRMLELQNDLEPSQSQVRINTKKFVQVLYLEAKRG
ncbi:response regulator [Paenibacillus beijingensis]|uniref:Transcriptional regulator n=1 Tax=Paenibacillus beijingensis TaxID=1126833 RepID=A0A0D5NNS4_9BACL|nr:response regulator [Paenibacillus beijingensis]AJY76969.1 transcriptional regulator [Paenibacillus beijingensis]